MDLMYIWYVYMPYIAIFLLIFCPAVFVWWYKRKLPSAARSLYAAMRKGLIPLLIVHDSGRSKIVLALERKGEGVLYTTDGRYKILPRYTSGEVEEEEVKKKTTKKNPKPETPEKRRGRSMFAEWTNKRSILVGLGTPFYVAYSGTMCLLNPLALALIEAGKMFVKDAEGKPIKSDEAKEEDLSEMLQPLMLLDARESKAIINSQYDESQIGACLVDSEDIGRIGRPSIFQRYGWLIMLLVMVAAAGVALMFLPNIIPIG